MEKEKEIMNDDGSIHNSFNMHKTQFTDEMIIDAYENSCLFGEKNFGWKPEDIIKLIESEDHIR